MFDPCTESKQITGGRERSRVTKSFVAKASKSLSTPDPDSATSTPRGLVVLCTASVFRSLPPERTRKAPMLSHQGLTGSSSGGRERPRIISSPSLGNFRAPASTIFSGEKMVSGFRSLTKAIPMAFSSGANEKSEQCCSLFSLAPRTRDYYNHFIGP